MIAYSVYRLMSGTLVGIALSGLAACGGGGGGGTGTATSSPTPPVTTPTPVGPSASSPEYQRNWGVAGIKAEAGWQQGASGAGVIVGVVDSGVNPNQADLIGRVSPASRDINSSRNQPAGTDTHGTFVAGVIASNFNDTGSVGVAFNSTVLSVRADNASGSFSGADLATALDYAVANGARIINLSVGTTAGPTGTAFEAALQRAVNAGVVFTFSAGNDSTDAAHWPSGYAVDPRYAGSILAVGSINQAGSLSSFSNRAGAAGGGFVVAPGEAVASNCDSAGCLVGSGTSFAAPHVAGGLALVLQAFPNMSGRQAVDLLFRTSRDLGAPGNDPVYGWGAVDLARAFAPAGTLSVPTGSATVSATLQPGTTMGPAFGDALQATGALRTVGWDHYQRPFEANLAAAYGPVVPSIVSPASSDHARRSEVDLDLRGGARLNLAAGLVDQPLASPADRFPWMPAERSRDVAVTYRDGRFAFTAWAGRASANPFAADNPDAFTALARSDRAVRADYRVGRWLVSADAGAGERRSVDLLEDGDGARYGRISGRAELRGAVHSVSFGVLEEPMGPLGAFAPSDSGLALPSRTTFGSWSAIWPLDRGFSLETQAGLGHTRLSGAVMTLDDAAWSTAWKATVRGPCAAVGLGCSEVRLSLSQPLRVESGRFAATLPDALPHYFAPVTFSRRTFSAAPSGRQLDAMLGFSQPTAFDGVFMLDAIASAEPGHRASEEPAYGLLATWRTGY